MHYAAINAWRDRDKRRQREISFEYLIEEKFYPFMYMAELIINYGRESCINAVLGKYMGGNYICIPDMDTGCCVGSLSDIKGNKERLPAHMCYEDAATVAHALRALSGYSGTDWL
ncbi:MAG: hypothetical protein K2O16_01305 [Lachnospiraceae bacterium]|nr:hypothetical protein [Lachnospiraceae bacterium]